MTKGSGSRWSTGTTTTSSSRCSTRWPPPSCRPRTSPGRTAIFRGFPSVDVRTAAVAAIDPTTPSVSLSDGETITGSHLVVAAGARPEFFGVPGAAEHAFPLYSVADAERLRVHLRELIRAAAEPDAAAEPGAADDLHVVVVGGGPTGVETAGALAELMSALVVTGRLRSPGRITLVDRGHTVLGAFSERSHDYAHSVLTKHGVQTRLATGVTAVHADRVELGDKTSIATRTVIWGGGESAAAVVGAAGLPTGRGGRVNVAPDLSVDGFPGVYAIGDAANIPGGGDGSADEVRRLPQLGSVAQQSGLWAAQNLVRELAGQSSKPFSYKDKGIMAMIGRNAAVAEVGQHRHQVEGPVAFAAWLGVHAMLLSGAHSKADAFLSWAWDYFDRDHSAVVEASATPARIAWADDAEDVPHIVPDRHLATASRT